MHSATWFGNVETTRQTSFLFPWTVITGQTGKKGKTRQIQTFKFSGRTLSCTFFSRPSLRHFKKHRLLTQKYQPLKYLGEKVTEISGKTRFI